MRTKLPKRSLFMKKRLNEIVHEILFVAKPKIAMIVLFGSYARGDFVIDPEGNYFSDLDLMIVVKEPKDKHSAIQTQIENRLARTGLRGQRFLAPVFDSPHVTIILEPIKKVNKKLEEKHYFFSDIIKEGILLYDSGEFKFAAPRILTLEEQKEIDIDYFEDYFSTGTGFLRITRDCLQRGELKLAAFQLHQATENFYNAILLVLSGYIPKTHDLKKLRESSLDRSKSKELSVVFPSDTEEENRLFELLRDAYVRARYDRTYKITEEELLYLIGRVEILKDITEKICKDWIDR